MIGFVQHESIAHWNTVMCGWVLGLVGAVAGWGEDDVLSLEAEDASLGTSRLRSRHSRARGLNEIELSHLWISMTVADSLV